MDLLTCALKAGRARSPARARTSARVLVDAAQVLAGIDKGHGVKGLARTELVTAQTLHEELLHLRRSAQRTVVRPR